MKKLSKLLALLLALALVFSLAACGESGKDDDEKKDDEGSSTVDKDDKDDKDDEEKEELSDEEMIVGEWLCSFDLGDAVNEMMQESIGDDSIKVDSSIYLNLGFEFEDDTVVMCMELDEDSLEDYMKDLCDVMIDYMIEMVEEQGMSKEDFEQQIEDESGMTLEEYIEDMMKEALESSFDEMSFESEPYYYKVDEKKGRIYIAEDEEDLEDSEEYMEYTIKGEKMTISELVDENGEPTDLGMEEYGIELPWEFEKQ